MLECKKTVVKVIHSLNLAHITDTEPNKIRTRNLNHSSIFGVTHYHLSNWNIKRQSPSNTHLHPPHNCHFSHRTYRQNLIHPINPSLPFNKQTKKTKTSFLHSNKSQTEKSRNFKKSWMRWKWEMSFCFYKNNSYRNKCSNCKNGECS